MICFSTRSSRKKTRCDAIHGRLVAEVSDGFSSRAKQERPVAIYSKKFAESCQNDERIFYNNKRATLYKTEMCRSFSETGSCRYGDSCQFCHSESELRAVERHPKYKTEICRTFWLEGSCPYGKRCCFAHLDNADLVEKAKKLSTLQKQATHKDCENAQLSAFRFAIDDAFPGCSEESGMSVRGRGSRHNGKLLSASILVPSGCAGEADEFPGSRHRAESTSGTLRACSGVKRADSTDEVRYGTAPDLFSNSTRLNGTFVARKEAFTFSKYCSGSFAPASPSKLYAVSSRKSTWALNKINPWRDEPLNFVCGEWEEPQM